MSRITSGHRPRFTTALAAVLAVPLAVIVTTTGRPVAAHAAPATPQSPDAAASTQARSSGKPVTVAADTTAYTDTVANPDGSYTLTSNQLPVHARKGGAWVVPDATLHTDAHGRLAPAAAASGLTLSGGGTGPLATLDDGNGHVLSLSLPMPLPAPQLSGASATYPGVLPGVDLTVTADIEGGVSDVLTVHDAVAAANPQLANLTFTTAATNLDVATDPTTGAITATDPTTHTPVFSAPPPLAWDSATLSSSRAQARAQAAQANPLAAADAPPAASSAAQPGVAAHVTAIPTRATRGAITLSTPAAALVGPGVTYPVYVDPQWSTTASPEAFVQSYHTSTTGYNPSDYLRTGFSDWDDGSGWLPGITRDYLWFNGIGATFSKYIQEAHLQLNQLGASSTGTYTLDVNTTSAWPSSPGSGINWTNQPGWTASTNYPTQTRSVSGTNGGYEVDLTTTIRSARNSNYTSIGLVMHMATESDHYAYRHFSKNPSVVITYWSTPNQPAGLTQINGTQSTGCNATSPGTWIPAAVNNTIDLHYTVSTADTNTPIGANTWVSTNGGAYAEYSTAFTYSSGNVPIDRTITLTNGSSYAWYAQTNNPYVWSPKSATCYFQYDATPPAAPTLTSPDYPANGPTTVSVGGSGTIRLASTGDPTAAGVASGVKGFNYNVNGTSINSGGGGEQQATANRECVAVVGGTTQCSFVANVTAVLSTLHWGTNTLWAQTVDFAGNVSQPVHYDFYVQQSAFGAYTPGTAGDVDGDNNPDLVTVDAVGNLRLFSHPDTVTVNPTGDTTADPQQYGGRVLIPYNHDLLWPGGSFAGALVAHAGSFSGHNADDLIMVQNGNLGVAQNTSANGQSWTIVSGVAKPACASCANYDGDDWSSVDQLVAVPSATAGGRPSLLTVEFYHGGIDVLLYPPAPTGIGFGGPTQLSVDDSVARWEDLQLISASPLPGLPGDTLIVRNLGSSNLEMVNDITALRGDPNLKVLATGLAPTTYPLVATVGRADASGNWPVWAAGTDGVLSVFSATTSGGITTWANGGAAGTVSNSGWANHELALAATYAGRNNGGIDNDGYLTPASFDRAGGSYSAQALGNATLGNGATSTCSWSSCLPGVAGGQSLITANGDVFAMAPSTPNNVDNWEAAGQRLPAPVDSNGTFADHIAFLGAAKTGLSGGATGTATVTFTDGNTQQIPIVLSDWTLNNNTFTPAGGNTIVATCAYHANTTTGAKDPHESYLFATVDTPLRDNGQTLQAAGQQIASVTLPAVGGMHIFAIAVN